MKKLLLTCMACVLAILVSSAATRTSTIRLFIHTNPGDSVTARLQDHYYGTKHMGTLDREVTQQNKSSVCAIMFKEITGPVYISLTIRSGRDRLILGSYLAMPGDSIHVHQSAYKYVSFAGRGAAGMQCRYAMDSMRTGTIRHMTAGILLNKILSSGQGLAYLQILLPAFDSANRVAKQVLASYRQALSKTQYELLYLNVVFGNENSKASTYSNTKYWVRKRKDSVDLQLAAIDPYYRSFLTTEQPAATAETLVQSPEFLNATMRKLLNDHPDKDPIDYIAARYQGILRDALLTLYINDYSDDRVSQDILFEGGLRYFSPGRYKDVMTTYRIKYLRGAPAYDFALKDVNGKTRTLREFRGKRVVIDFWYTGCTGCVQLYVNALKEVEQQRAGDSTIVFLSIANDADKNKWLESIHRDIYTSISAVNLFTGTTEINNPVLRGYRINAFPTLVVVDEMGKIILNQDAPKNAKELSAWIDTK